VYIGAGVAPIVNMETLLSKGADFTGFWG